MSPVQREAAAALLRQVRPTLYLTLGEGGEGTGQTRIGGAPDLPADFDWPEDGGEALTFALQIKLADLPDFAGNPFPPAGLLSFFVGLDEPASDVQHQILLFEDAAQCQRRAVPAETSNEAFAEVTPHHLKVVPGVGLPLWATQEHTALMDDMDDEQQNAYEELGWALEPQGVVGRLLGHAAGIGHDPREDAFVVREMGSNSRKRNEQDISRAQHWRHLLTIASDDRLNLGIWDAGYLQFLIKDSDLAALDFGRVYAAVESS